MAANLMCTCTLSLGRPKINSKTKFISSSSYLLATKRPQLGFRLSQFAGFKLSISQTPPLHPRTTVQTIFAKRICPFTGKKANKANKVSFSNHKTKKLQFVNLQYKRVWWEAGKRYLKLRLSTNALKTIEKNGLDAVAKKAGIDPRKE
ncbi:uncharacterized protein LOC110035578 [Phalaenopsis equestris]|uniref:uncharacterized protein LOC110035578 n=1 Tax=Phalaenopsis equestris TaxID=78828 RepID=UPI0009E33417|nr:uncharacterized protein LOC110035578 [Phalaenopsis equestris]